MPAPPITPAPPALQALGWLAALPEELNAWAAYWDAFSPNVGEPQEPAQTEPGSQNAGMDNRHAFAVQFGPDEGHDEEFDGAGIGEDELPAGWIWANKANAVWRQSFSQGRVDHGGSGGDVYDLHAALKPLPDATNWKTFSHLVGLVAGSPSYVATICLYNEANGRFVTFAAYKATETAGIQFFVSYFPSANPASGEVTTLVQGPKVFPASPHFYFRIEKAGDVYKFFVNYDGGCWFQVTGGVNLSANLGTPTHIGMAANSQFPCHCGMEWLRIRDVS